MRRIPVVVVTLLALMLSLNAFAQTTTANVRGKVTNESGNVIPKAEINAVSTSSGFVHTVNADSNGSYLLGGLTPGTYNLVVAAPGYEPKSQDLTVLVGQTLDVNLRLTPTAVLTESITVVGNQLVDTRTSEIATNVTPQQIENLPQNDRNFLNFANLAPGVRMSSNPESKKVSAGAQPADQVNVFIDGVSFKNDVLPGGISGQENSRGNPFPQNAVQEFRVLTQNYGAQYDHASSAVISAITKSGGNQFDASVFAFYQPKRWVAETPFQFPGTLTSNPDYRRYQTGVSAGGPIIRDRLNYFFSYEGNDEHTTRNVTVGNPQYLNQFAQYQGTFGSPFRSNLAFGKISLQPMKNQLADFSGSYRKERDIRDFGGQTSFESATNIKNWVYNSTFRHLWNSSNALNQASLSWQKYGWNPSPTTPTPGLNYIGIIRIGGNSTYQNFEQRRIELRDDYTFAGFNMGGAHTLQAGGNLDFLRYKVTKYQCGNPEYRFRSDISFDFPFEACFGGGNPTLSDSNREYGLYGQDNWVVNPHLNLNLGLRWDYESNMLNKDFVTPAAIVAGLTGRVDSSYFSTGDNRPGYKKAIQPRLGFSYDIFADSKSVVFGGAGRYYDRLFYNATFDERFRRQFSVFTFRFSADGLPRDNNPTIKWDPKYLTPAGLAELVAISGGEVYMLSNKTQPQHSDQWNIGYRQALGTWQGAVSYNSVRSSHGFSWQWAGGQCCLTAPGYGATLISEDAKRTWYDGIYLTLDRPYTSQARWGAHVAYTHGKATQNGGIDTFGLDYPTVEDFPRYITPGTERDRIVASGIFGLPFDVRFSTLINLGSGAAREMHDFSRGFGPGQGRPFGGTLYPEKTNGFADRSVDFRLEKRFNVVRGTSVGLIGEVFNAFNFHNYGCLNNFLPPEGNPTLGQPTCVINLGRRFQVGLRFDI